MQLGSPTPIPNSNCSSRTLEHMTRQHYLFSAYFWFSVVLLLFCCCWFVIGYTIFIYLFIFVPREL